MKRTILLLTLLFSTGVCVVPAAQRSSFDTSRLSEAGQKAYRLLLESEEFALGYAGSLTEQEPALLTLLGEEAAADALMGLVEEASLEGGLYGLLGLRQLQAESFRKAAEKYMSKEEPPFRIIHDGLKVSRGIVSTNIDSGCVSSWEDKLKVVSAIESGSYDELLRRGVGEHTY